MKIYQIEPPHGSICHKALFNNEQKMSIFIIIKLTDICLTIQQQHSSLLAQYWKMVYYEFITLVAPLGFRCSFVQMKNKWKK
jgi:hypothetical protein